jgi:hypothetical protein
MKGLSSALECAALNSHDKCVAEGQVRGANGHAYCDILRKTWKVNLGFVPILLQKLMDQILEVLRYHHYACCTKEGGTFSKVAQCNKIALLVEIFI